MRELTAQLEALAVPRGGVVVVHAAFKRLRPVPGGPEAVIRALREVLGPTGTLVMPSMADDDGLFDPRRSPCRGMGIIAETFWRQPGVLRSDSPHAFAAIGPLAERITQPHPIDIPHGLDSPPGRVYALDGHVLLLGVGHDANTTVHVAENLAKVRYHQRYVSTVVNNGQLTHVEYSEPDHCCENFAKLDAWLGERQRRWPFAHGEARLARSRDIVEAALKQLRLDERVFLHPPGACSECDAALASIPRDT